MLQTAANALNNSVNDYPVRWAAFARSIILLVSTFWVQLTSEHIAVIMLVVESGLAIITHNQVTPNAVIARKENLDPNSPVI